MPDEEKSITSFHDDIVSWRSQRLSLRVIAENLRERGLDIDHNAVRRYCKKAGIPDPQNMSETFYGFDAGVDSGPSNPPSPAASDSPRELTNTAVRGGVRAENTPNGQLFPDSGQVRPAPVTKRAKIPFEFPDLEPQRMRALSLAIVGFTLPEIRNAFVQNIGFDVPAERWGEYLDAVFREISPLGQVSPILYDIHPQDQKWKQDAPILGFGTLKAGDIWKLSDFCEGTLILGASGSGKTCGSGRNLASEFIKAGFGGLILTTKPGEADEWLKMAILAERGSDVCRIRLDGLLRLDVLAYESQRPGQGGRLTENLLHFFKNLVSVLSTKRGHSTNAAFWQTTGDQLLRNLLNCFLAAGLPLTIDSLAQFLTHAPLSAAAVKDDQWREIPVFGQCLARVEKLATTADAQRSFELLKEYWLHHYPTLAAATRSCITIGFAAMVDALRSPAIHKLIASQTTITPEAVLNGHLVILDLPINETHEAGLLVQTAWKYLFQRAVLNRADKDRGDGCRPVFLWEDECQNFLIDYDAEFNRLARDRRVLRVMISQNINNLYDAFGGGDAARVKVDSILGTLNTRIFHANGDLATNKWASESIGTHEKKFAETSTTPPPKDTLNFWSSLFKKPTVTTTTHTVREPLIHPHDFAGLKPGGPQNGMVAEALITQVGRRFVSGFPFSKVNFNLIVLPDQAYSEEQIRKVNEGLKTEPA